MGFVTISPYASMKNGNVVAVPKEWQELTIYEKKDFYLNEKALNILAYALTLKEYNQVSTCDTVKKVWDVFQLTYEVTKEIRQERKNNLTSTSIRNVSNEAQ
ncbi:hypothetical protein CDL12_14462 [Handroanthus impetiginosus]|uniref:Uncharacterized protein n=1 Tax=Handroanthus impetiginosus TaxID=429701 RepID=A0A2G9H623_9LAMI|nr:hypothetical protein CDL12_14462 [Handroanthus impetiginosus]